MLRPSDIAPNSTRYNSESGQLEPHLFTTREITFRDDGLASIVFFYGIKNDTSRSGFDAHLPDDAYPHLDPVLALQTYITRTDAQCPYPAAPVFVTLQSLFRALQAGTIASIMEDAIRIAGLRDQGYSAKDFRPTGATVAIDSGTNPE